jgi:hypothetical protein
LISQPVPQHVLRGLEPQRPIPRAVNTTEHQARRAGRLTDRDKWILRMLHEHRVLISEQITTLAFPSYRSGRQRLRELWQWSVLDRFLLRLAGGGTTPLHYVLGPAGASVLAAEHGLDVKDLGYRRERVTGIAHHQRLAHTVGVSDWFTALIDHAHHSPGTRVLAWWSEGRCAHHFGDLARPDAYGRWLHQPASGTPGGQHAEVGFEFFLEYDLATERPAARLAAKLTGYADLAAATGIITPLLIWLPTTRREARARPALHEIWRSLDNPAAVPVATAAATLLDPTAGHPSPADSVWLPLDTTAGAGGRCGLAALAVRWPAPPPLSTPQPGIPGPRVPSRGPGVLPPPDPMPPRPPQGGDPEWRK